jgi:hypothetical protein
LKCQKGELGSLYDILAIREARQKFEERLIERLREKLHWINTRVEWALGEQVDIKEMEDAFPLRPRKAARPVLC